MILLGKIHRDRIVQKFGDLRNSNEARVSSISQVCIAMPYTLLLIIADMCMLGT